MNCELILTYDTPALRQKKENILPIVVDAWEKLSPPLDFFKQDNIVYSNASYK
jgi:hypothetical protein